MYLIDLLKNLFKRKNITTILYLIINGTYAYSVGVYYGDNGIAVSAMEDIIGMIK